MQLGHEPGGEALFPPSCGRLFPGGLCPADLVHSLVWPQVQDLFEAKGNDRLKLLVLYSGEDDELLRRAAAGGLAMLTSMRPSLCSRIPQVVSASLRGGEVAWSPQHGSGWWSKSQRGLVPPARVHEACCLG